MDELKKQAEGFYIGLGDLQSETGFMDGVNYAIDKSKPIIESLLKKEYDKGYRDGHRNTTIKYFVEGGSE